MKKSFQYIIMLLILFVSCKVDEPKVKYNYTTEPDYTWGYAEFYGAYYNYEANIKNNVVSLSLFTDSLFINDEENLDGIGQYLFIEDIFCAPTDTILPEGTYTVSKSRAPFTFTPGEFFVVDGNKYRIGTYIYYIEKNSSFSVIKNISRGSFIINRIGSKEFIHCDVVLEDSTKLKGSFKAELPYIDQSVTFPSNIKRNKLLLEYPLE